MSRKDPFIQAEIAVQQLLVRLPAWLSRFFGYREKPLPPSPLWVVCSSGFIGAFGGLGILLAIFAHTDYFTNRSVPPIVASYVRKVSHISTTVSYGTQGASAILCYGAIDVPLAQPAH